MKRTWIDYTMDLAVKKESFYTNGNRKIFRGEKLVFTDLNNDMDMSTSAYTKAKMSQLVRNYHHEESIAVAVELWNKRLKQSSYGSVSFTCFGHFVKGGSVDHARSKRASVFGPCLQSVVLSRSDHGKAGHTWVDVFWRTTELFKKFPADLVFLRDHLLPRFDFGDYPVKSVTCHFANATLHPMYFAVVVPHLDDPIEELEVIREEDPKYHQWLVKATGRYLIDRYTNGIEKHSQSLSVMHGLRKYGDPAMLVELTAYLDKWHPGLRWEDKE